jgi:hypothetical protein
MTAREEIEQQALGAYMAGEPLPMFPEDSRFDRVYAHLRSHHSGEDDGFNPACPACRYEAAHRAHARRQARRAGSTAVVIRCIGQADGEPTLAEGCWLASLRYVEVEDKDREAEPGSEDYVEFTWTVRKSQAMRFESAAEAALFYRQVYPGAPLRPDGKPNRPLTAYHIVIESAAGQ